MMISKIFVVIFFGFGFSFAIADANLENVVRNNTSVIKQVAGDKFAGTWISRDGSKQVLALTSPIDMESEVFKGLSVEYVTYSEAQLLRTQREGLGDLQRNHQEIYGSAIDLENNKIAVRAHSSNFEKVRKILSSSGIDMNMVYLEHQNSPLTFAPPSLK